MLKKKNVKSKKSESSLGNGNNQFSIQPPLTLFSISSKIQGDCSLVQPPFVNHLFLFHKPNTADVTNDMIPQDASTE